MTQTDALTGAELAKVLEKAIENRDGESLRTAVRDRLRRTEAWVGKVYHHRRHLNAGLAALGKAGALDGLIHLLERADGDAVRRFTRENPGVHVRTSRTVDQVRVFLAEHGTPTARRAFARALRGTESLSGSEAAEETVRHLKAGEESAAAALLERIADTFSGQPAGDEVKALRKELDVFLDALIKGGHVQAFAHALARRDAGAGRRLGALQLYGLADQLRDLMKRYASDGRRSAWSRALGKKAASGASLGAEMAKQLAAGKTGEALDILNGDVLASLDDRFGAGGDESIKRLSTAIKALKEKKALAGLVEAAHEADEAFRQANPHMIFVGTLHRLRSAVDRLGGEATRDAFREAFQPLQERLRAERGEAEEAGPEQEEAEAAGGDGAEGA